MRRSGRIFFAAHVFIATVFLAAATAPCPVLSAEPPLTASLPSASLRTGIGERFLGEEFNYKVGFWIFDGVAVAKIKMEKKGGLYVATLTAQTTGAVRWLHAREDVYVATLEEVDGGRRFRTLVFEESSVIGSKRKRSVTVLDKNTGTLKWTIWRKGVEKDNGSLAVLDGVYYDDPLAAFYNFRYGAYGTVEENKKFRIRTFPKASKQEVDIDLDIRSAPNAGNGKEEAVYLADARVDKDLFDSSSGLVEILFDKELVPIRAVAKDIVLFGDVRGELTR
ncbi:MAG: DUF3108 domain-containing protein [Thermodesulfobacteriota bacterium]